MWHLDVPVWKVVWWIQVPGPLYNYRDDWLVIVWLLVFHAEGACWC